MTKQEEKILRIIKDNPLIEQNEIADILNIARSTVAVHISNLQKHGYIKGKGYILNNNDSYVLGIGAANIDIYGKSKIKIKTHYDHPAFINSGVGGVTKNILTNISKLGIDTKFITAIGDDGFGNTISHDCKVNNIDTTNVITIKGASSGVFMQAQDENNDMYLALCDMSVLDNISSDYIEKKRNVLLNAKIVLIDTSLRIETIEKILDICENKVPVYVDPISDNYALKLKPYIHRFDCVKPNKGELENLSGIKINSEKDAIKACEKLLNKGLKRIFVSMGKDGILYMDAKNKLKRSLKPVKNMVNASGAGDAAMAAIIYGYINELDIEKTIEYALAAGIGAIMSDSPINENMSVNLLNKIIKENKR